LIGYNSYHKMNTKRIQYIVINYKFSYFSRFIFFVGLNHILNGHCNFFCFKLAIFSWKRTL